MSTTASRPRRRQGDGERPRYRPVVASVLALLLSVGAQAAIIRASDLTGQNIFTVRSDGVVARLQQVHQVVIRRVETMLPDRVVIYARERVPMVAWQSGGSLYL